ncbi:serine/threonine-protein kinase, partial [Sorangium cellulosum]|uniref:serine/threonine-protein kinase n=1 Tax=Sorangium cellulosum TaxID=56 RepID=UPI0012DB65B8
MTQRSGEWSLPEAFEEYRIIRRLGEGAMGQVYLAEDRLLTRLVAIKFIASESPSRDARERFFVEARAVARLSHPNVVAVHRVGEVQRRPFLVSEYVRGQSLDAIAKPVPPHRALTIAMDLARGVAAAHRRGVLHRDIKPANAVISEEGTVKVLDFGLAELLPDSDPPPLEAPGTATEGAATRPEGRDADPASASPPPPEVPGRGAEPGAEGAATRPGGPDADPASVASTADGGALPPPPRARVASLASTADAPQALEAAAAAAPL